MKTKEVMRVNLHVNQAKRLLLQVLHKDTIICTETAELTDAVQGLLLLTTEYSKNNIIDDTIAKIWDNLYSAYLSISDLNEKYFDVHIDADNTSNTELTAILEVRKKFSEIIKILDEVKSITESE